jgi:hypothetical protein
MTFNTLLQRLTQLIQPHRAEQLAKEHGWRRRAGKILGFEFLFSCLGQSSALELTLSSQASSLSQPVSRQALDQRYTPAAVEFFKAAFQECLVTSLGWKTDSLMVQRLQQRFAAVRLFDSTHCACSDALEKIFPASGGGASRAGVKVLLSYDYGAGQLHPLEVLPATHTDQALAASAAQQVGPGELGIFDKGFYKAQPLRCLAQRRGYFLIPWHRTVTVWELDANGQRDKQIDVAGSLKVSKQSLVEWKAVHLGQTEQTSLKPVRLVAYRLSEESANRRRAQLRETCRTHGRQPTEAALELAGWLILVTNAPVDLLPSASVGYLYRVRWQIELIFKQFKSVLRLDALPTKNPSRVRCEIWARLLNALLVFTWYQHSNAACLQSDQREISFAKVAKLLQQDGQLLMRALFSARERIETEFRTLWKKILRLARKEHQPSRPTTWENLCVHWLDVPSAH